MIMLRVGGITWKDCLEMIFKMNHVIKPVLSKDEYQYKRKQLFENEEYDLILYWIANEVMKGEI